jgi:hypothetical protein
MTRHLHLQEAAQQALGLRGRFVWVLALVLAL